jgi:hypothetical protein
MTYLNTACVGIYHDKEMQIEHSALLHPSNCILSLPLAMGC